MLGDDPYPIGSLRFNLLAQFHDGTPTNCQQGKTRL